jgi:hypothetical protein
MDVKRPLVMSKKLPENSGTTDSAQSRPGFFQRFKTAIAKPITLFIAVLATILGVSFEYAFSRVLDTIWEAEPPEEIVRLNQDLQSSSDELKIASADLQSLISRVSLSTTDDPGIQAMLESLSERLSSLDGLITKASSNTEKAATLSKVLHDDYMRVKSISSGDIDGMPNLLLGVGEAVQVCNGLASFGISEIEEDGAIRYKLSEKSVRKTIAGNRIKISNNSHIDVLGIRNNQGMFKVACSVASY